VAGVSAARIADSRGAVQHSHFSLESTLMKAGSPVMLFLEK
jgi:hypothetical protein